MSVCTIANIYFKYFQDKYLQQKSVQSSRHLAKVFEYSQLAKRKERKKNLSSQEAETKIVIKTLNAEQTIIAIHSNLDPKNRVHRNAGKHVTGIDLMRNVT